MSFMKSFLRGTLFLLILFFLGSKFISAQTATTPSGSGTENDPYLIATIDNLYWVTQNSTSWDKYFEQTADIDASSTSTWDSGEGFTPIGNSSPYFTGTYDGGDFGISSIFINRPNDSRMAMFGITNGAILRNINLDSVEISGFQNVSALVAVASTSSSIENTYSTGQINGTDDNVGGIVGRLMGGSSITTSSSTATITGSDFVGGLVGKMQGPVSISQSFANGNVSGSGAYIGGLVGTHNSSTISNSYATGNVTSSSIYAGGLSGSNSSSTITNSYSTGTVSSSDPDFTGGLLGVNNSTVTNSYWNSETSGVSNGIGIDYNSQTVTGLTSTQMRQQASYSGWDFANTWTIKQDSSFAYLQSNIPDSLPGYIEPQAPTHPFAGGTGTEQDPFQISTPTQLDSVRNYLDAHFVLINDIDLDVAPYNSGEGWEPIGTSTRPFTGNFDGEDNLISNLYINRPTQDNVGFFSSTSGGLLENIGLNNIEIIGDWRVGGITGLHADNSIIRYCFASGNVEGNYYVGGLVGVQSNSSEIRFSYTTGNVSLTNHYGGGLVGSDYGSTISNSYSLSKIIGQRNYLGGLVGITQSGSTISKSYATGDVNGVTYISPTIGYINGSTYSDIYFNTETSTPYNQRGTGLTSSQMRQEASFPALDFTNTWTIDEGNSFPYLQSNIPDSLPGTIVPVFAGGSGTEEDPYQISTPTQLDSVRHYLDAHFVLVNDIDLDVAPYNEGEGWEPIGEFLVESYAGNFDGNDFSVLNLFIDRGDQNSIGLFGSLGGSSSISNIVLENIDITGRTYTGGLVGHNNGADINNLNVSGQISGNECVGGIAGYHFSGTLTNSFSNSAVSGWRAGGLAGCNNGSISFSYTTGDITGTFTQIGGAIGQNTGIITNSYSLGDVVGGTKTGGFIGRNTGAVSNSYSNGSVFGTSELGGFIGVAEESSTLTNNYWSKEISKQLNSSSSTDTTGITQLTIPEMTQQASYSGWDFVSDTTWGIVEGGSFPYLKNVGTQITTVVEFNGAEGWRTVGHAGDATYSDFLDRIWTQGYVGSDAGTGGFNSNVHFYDEATSSWKTPSDSSNYFGTNSSTPSESLSGALVWFYPDDDNDGTDDPFPKYLVANSFSRTKDSTFTVPLSYSTPESPDSSGWHLVSNPYPTSLDWRQIVQAGDNQNTFPIAYIWDHSLNGNNGGYKVNFGYPLPPGAPEEFFFDGDIPNMQAFWVKATEAGASLTFKPEYQNAAKNPYKESKMESTPEWLSLELRSGDFSDQFMLFESADKAQNMPKLTSLSGRYVEIAGMDQHNERVISTSLNTEEIQQIPLDLQSTEVGNYSISINNAGGLAEKVHLILIDHETGSSTPLSMEESYSFNLSETSEKAVQKTVLDLTNFDHRSRLKSAGIISPRFTLEVRQGTALYSPTMDVPNEFTLNQNYPNPFNPSSTIRFGVPEAADVRLEVFNMLGQKVATLVNEKLQAGYHSAQFNAGHFSSGVYIYRIQAGSFVQTKKMMLIK
jgi:hypothetical protein